MTRTRLTSGWSASSQGAAAASFADVLRMARSVLPEALVDGHGWARLAARAGRLPATAADAMFGFECRLDRREAQADLLLSVLPQAGFADALIGEDIAAVPRASSLARLLSALRQPRSAVATAVDLVALEYDVADTADAQAPGVFLRSTAESGYADSGLLTAAIALAAGWNEDPCVRDGVARVLAALPPGAAVRWAGAFPERKQRAVRLMIRALGDGVAAFLTRIGWPGDVTAIDGILSPLRAAGVDNHVFALDVTPGGVEPGLGVELSRPGQPAGGWREVLATMAHKGWCLPGKATALGRATRSERLFSSSGVSELHCGINHLKLALAGGGVAGAKGYVACILRPVSQSGGP